MQLVCYYPQHVVFILYIYLFLFFTCVQLASNKYNSDIIIRSYSIVVGVLFIVSRSF